MARLTAKQARFVDEYLVDLNATQAAIRAGYSRKRADAIGFENLRKPEIESAVQAAMERRSARTEVTAERVLEELAKVAFLDPRRFFNDEGGLVDVCKLPDDVAAAIQGMEVVGENAEGEKQSARLCKIKYADKLKALELCGRHLGMFTGNFKGKFLGAIFDVEYVSSGSE